MPGITALNHQTVPALKAVIALAATALLLWWWYAEHRRLRSPGRTRDVGLALLGILGFVGWWNFGAFHFGGIRVHHYEFFHYYLGAKYSSELGYTGLYDCVAVAEAERGRGAEVSTRWIRDLATNELHRGSPAVADPALCRSRFSGAERWGEFTHDVEWFRARIPPEKWLDAQMDHGYNASPVWTMVGRALSNTGPVSDTSIAFLWWLDPVLLVAMWAAVWWAFGWRVLCVALIWWGTNHAGRYIYIGGAFLRQDWLFLAVAGVCLAKRGRMAAAGFALTWSALVRVFPAFIILGLLLKVAVETFRARRLSLTPGHRQFAYGAILALAVCLPLSLTVNGVGTGALSTWRSFAANTQKHASSPTTNAVGLPVVMAFDPANRSERVSAYWVSWPWDVWEEGRRRALQARRPIQITIVASFIVLLALALRGREDWIALTLGIGAIPFCVEIANYYYGILLGLAFLWPRYQIAGVGLAFTAFLSNIVLVPWSADDDRYTAISLTILLLVTVISAAVAIRRRGTKGEITQR